MGVQYFEESRKVLKARSEADTGEGKSPGAKQKQVAGRQAEDVPSAAADPGT